MRIILITSLFKLMAFVSMAQNDEIFSFYFDQKAVKTLPEAMQINPRYFGKYELSNNEKYQIRKSAGEYLIVDEDGVYIEKNRISHISREEVRENSQYRVRKGWLHGVVENDSIPCALEGEDYYFLVPTKTYLYEKGIPPSRLVQFTSNTYGIFSFENNGYFSVIVLTFSPGGVDLKEVEFKLSGNKDLSKIASVRKLENTTESYDTFILTPTKKEWEQFILPNCLSIYDAYDKIKEDDK